MRHYLIISLFLFSFGIGQNKVNRKNLIQRGDSYTGELIDGKRSGFGTYLYVSGNKYEGQWKDGKREGNGTFQLKDGGKYVGEWKND